MTSIFVAPTKWHRPASQSATTGLPQVKSSLPCVQRDSKVKRSFKRSYLTIRTYKTKVRQQFKAQI